MNERLRMLFRKKPQYSAENPRFISEEERLALRNRVNSFVEKMEKDAENKRTKAALKKLKEYNSQGKKRW